MPMITDPAKGTYILWLYTPSPTMIEIGKLGVFTLPDGLYAYVGSAMGSGGLCGRLKHHLSPICRPHWHIDYLRQVATCKEVWATESNLVLEHEWASLLRRMPGATIPVRRFGASDCRCESHLFHFAEPIEFGQWFPPNEAILRTSLPSVSPRA